MIFFFFFSDHTFPARALSSFKMYAVFLLNTFQEQCAHENTPLHWCLSLYSNQGKVTVSKILELAASNPNFPYFNAHPGVPGAQGDTGCDWWLYLQNQALHAQNGADAGISPWSGCAAGCCGCPSPAPVLAELLTLGIDLRLSIKAIVPLRTFLT